MLIVLKGRIPKKGEEECSDGMIRDIKVMTNCGAIGEGQGPGEEAYYIPIPWAGVGGPNAKS